MGSLGGRILTDLTLTSCGRDPGRYLAISKPISGRHMELGVALAQLGRREDAIREGERAVALDPVAKDQLYGPYVQHQLAWVYILVGEPEKALDRLEPLLKMPYYLTPRWLAIDPTFDPLRKNLRFQRLLAGGK